MFYSTEILCDKRYALSTVWRAGNTAPGARTTGIRRKAVLEVSVEQTCGTIKDPPGAPIALRLQGTLLYGTARIYQEQCRYVLNDSERTQRALAKLSSSLLDDKLDSNAGKARKVQIVVPNDPSFDLDLFQLPPFDFDAPMDSSFISQECQASWTNMSLASRSSNNTQLPELVLDADSSVGGSVAGGFHYSASGASNMQDSPTPFGKGYNFQEEENLLVDVGLFIDEDGNIIEEEPRAEPQLPAYPTISSRASKAQTAADGDLAPMIVDDDDGISNPFSQPVITANQAGNQAAGSKGSIFTHTLSSPSTISSPSAMLSKQVHQRASRTKAYFIDDVTQIPLSDYFNYVTDYGQHMERVSEKKNHARDVRRANDTARNRQFAYSLTFGRGVFGVADEVKGYHADHPLAQMFSGEALGETILGEALARARRRKGETVDPSTPVASRAREAFDGFDNDIELGRQPASALSDNPSLALNRHSSVLPGSSAHGSAQHSATGIRQHPDGRLSSAGFPDSPSFIERYSDEGMDLPPQLPSSRGDHFLPPISSPVVVRGAANRDQDGNNDENDKIGEEMRNVSVFFRLVREMATEEGVVRSGWGKHRWIEFGDAVAPIKRNRSAVVGAFMSLLSLATTSKLRIQQEEAQGDVIDRDIFIGVLPNKRSKGKGKGKKKRSFYEASESNTDGGNRPSSRQRLMSGSALSSPMIVGEPFFGGSRPVGIELSGAA